MIRFGLDTGFDTSLRSDSTHRFSDSTTDALRLDQRYLLPERLLVQIALNPDWIGAQIAKSTAVRGAEGQRFGRGFGNLELYDNPEPSGQRRAEVFKLFYSRS